MSKLNLSDIESKHGSTKRSEIKLRIVLMTRATDEDVIGFPRALMINFDDQFLTQIGSSAELFEKGGFKSLSVDAQDFVKPLYLAGDIRPKMEGWSDPSNFSLQFSGRNFPMYVTATVTDCDDYESPDGLESDRFTLSELQTLQAGELPDGYVQLASSTFAKLEDIESQLRRLIDS